MNTVREKGYAKVNLFLDVFEKNGEFHDIDSVVCSVNIYDEVIVTDRKDDKIVVRTPYSLYGTKKEENLSNAYLSAKLFKETFSTPGVTVTVKRNIPTGGGLGGSSADISATLNAMKKLFSVSSDLTELSAKLGSDAPYMLTGGFARLAGRGTKVTPLDCLNDVKLHLLIATPYFGVGAKECYDEFDVSPSLPKDKGADKLIENLSEGIIKKEDFYNALYAPAVRINDEISRVYGLIDGLSPLATFMTGSGSSVCALFETEELCLWAKDKLKREKLNVAVTESLTAKEIDKPPFLKNPFVL